MLNIAGYRFVELKNLPELQADLHHTCQSLALKGTILLSHEGININLCGDESSVTTFKKIIDNQSAFVSMNFRESTSASPSFKRLKVKIKKEIISLHQPEVSVKTNTAPYLKPALLKKWLDEKKEMVLLDTRNDYEYRFGTFHHAVNLGLNQFHEFPKYKDSLNKHQPIVMFCTGGIRCEKAAAYLLNEGFHDVFQLEGGILNYFKSQGSAHYQGECFVFDERVSLNSKLEKTGTRQCSHCQGPIAIHHQTCGFCKSEGA